MLAKALSSGKNELLAVVRERAFQSLWVGQISSQLASNTLLFVLALRIYQTTGSNAVVSGLFMVYGIPALLFGMIAGTIVDKLDNRSVLLACDLARACLVLGFLFFSGSVVFIYILTFIGSLISQYYVPAEAPLIPRLVKGGKHLVIANSLFSFTYFSSLAIGSIVAGPLLRLFGTTGVFIIISVLFLFAFTRVRGIPREEHTEQVLRRFFTLSPGYLLRRLYANSRDGISYVMQAPALRESLLLLTGTQIIFALLGTLGPGFADRVMHVEVTDASLLITGPAVLGIIVGALWVGNGGYRYSPRTLINAGIIGAGIVLLILSFVVYLPSVSIIARSVARPIMIAIGILLFFLLGVANGVLDGPANSMLQKEAQGNMRGRVYGMLTAAVGGLGIVPVVTGGLLADMLGVDKVITILGLAITCFGIYRLKYAKDVKSL